MHISSSSAKAALVGAFLLCLGATAGSAQILSVDFNSTDTNGVPTATQAGFQTFTVSASNATDTLSQTFTGLDASSTSGSVIVTLGDTTLNASTTPAGTNLISRDRTTAANNGAFTYHNLYEDFAIGKANLTLSLSGLNASTSYTVTFYTYDANGSGNSKVTNTTNTTGTGQSGTVSWTGGDAFTDSNANTKYTITLTVQSDTGGNLSFNITEPSNGGQGLLNGFQISAAAVPEPSAAWLMGLGLGGAFLGLRRTLRRA